jgi:DNA-binding protein
MSPKLSRKAIKSTVRNGKKNVHGSTQRFLPIAEIRNDTVLLKNGGLRAVLKVEPLNFNLKSETEQQGIIAGYEGFVNTLTFPVQVVIRSTKVNIDPYMEQTRAQAERQQNLLLKAQTESYAAFIEKIVDVAEIMQKRFYVVVPLDDFALQSQKRPGLLKQFFSWVGVDDTSAKAAARYRSFPDKSIQLKDRVQQVQAGLHNVGLNSNRLTTHELIELYYQIFNPKTSQEQKIGAKQEVKTAKMTL